VTKRRSRRQHDKKQALVIREDAPDTNAFEAARSGRLRAIAAFTLTCIGLYALIHALPPSFTRPFNELTASTLGLVLNAIGLPALTAGDVVRENGLAVRIIPECTPLFASCLFISFVAFHPSSWRQKATGLAWGIPALYLGNVFRLAATFVISRYNIRLFDVTHVYLGQVFTLFLVILCCTLWMRRVERSGTREGSSQDTMGSLIRFGLISAVVFLVWLRLHHEYILLLDRLMVFGFSLFGRSAGLAHETAVYYETFSIVIAVSLVLAASRVPWRKRVRLLGTALGVLFLIHLFHRIDNALMALFHITTLLQTDLALVVIGQYLVPVLILLYLVRFQKRGVSTVPL
jgi:exosortase H (IPTLxxWG-CTERM-specific)